MLILLILERAASGRLPQTERLITDSDKESEAEDARRQILLERRPFMLVQNNASTTTTTTTTGRQNVSSI